MGTENIQDIDFQKEIGLIDQYGIYEDTENNRLFLRFTKTRTKPADPKNPTDTKTTQTVDHFYVVDKTKALGSGGAGKVYEAYAVNPETNKVILGKDQKPVKYALKQMEVKEGEGAHVTEESVKNEAAYLAKTLKIEKPIIFPANGANPKQAYLLMEFVSGRHLDSLDLSGKDFLQRVLLFQQEVLNLNNTHQLTSRGPQFIHRDLKPANILVSYEPVETVGDTKKTIEVPHVTNVDGSLAIPIGDLVDDADGIMHSPAGSLFYLPPEIFDFSDDTTGKVAHSRKLDIHSLTPVFAKILGAKDPLKTRKSMSQDTLLQKDALVSTPYDIDDILTDVKDIPGSPDIIKRLLLTLLKRMESLDDFKKRPDDEELLRFISDLVNYTRISQLSSDQTKDYQQEKEMYLARMILIAEGLWHQNTVLPVPASDKKTTAGKTSKDVAVAYKKFSDLDWENCPRLAQKVVLDFTSSSLNTKNLNKEIQKVTVSPKLYSSTPDALTKEFILGIKDQKQRLEQLLIVNTLAEGGDLTAIKVRNQLLPKGKRNFKTREGFTASALANGQATLEDSLSLVKLTAGFIFSLEQAKDRIEALKKLNQLAKGEGKQAEEAKQELKTFLPPEKTYFDDDNEVISGALSIKMISLKECLRHVERKNFKTVLSKISAHERSQYLVELNELAEHDNPAARSVRKIILPNGKYKFDTKKGLMRAAVANQCFSIDEAFALEDHNSDTNVRNAWLRSLTNFYIRKPEFKDSFIKFVNRCNDVPKLTIIYDTLDKCVKNKPFGWLVWLGFRTKTYWRNSGANELYKSELPTREVKMNSIKSTLGAPSGVKIVIATAGSSLPSRSQVEANVLTATPHADVEKNIANTNKLCGNVSAILSELERNIFLAQGQVYTRSAGVTVS